MPGKFNRLKIAIFCANEFAIPPSSGMKDIYAPLWMTHYITEELIKRKHRVTLFASSDSKTRAELISDNFTSLAENKKLSKFYKQVTEIKKRYFFQEMAERKEVINYYESFLLSKFCQMTLFHEFDIVLIDLIGLRALPFAAICPVPVVCILNDPLHTYNKFFLQEYKKRYRHLHYIAISQSQAKSAPALFSDVVYNGIKIENFPFNRKPKDYLLFSGRICAEKGTDEAIQAAKKTGRKLMIMGRHTEDFYWREKIKPQLKGEIKYQGLLPHLQTAQFYKNAKAFLFPIKWPEPFGLTMIEAMACGTPVIAFDKGSVREIIKDGETGFIVKNMREMVQAIKKIDQIDREKCRKWVEEKFTVEKMVQGYEKIFYRILARQKSSKSTSENF